MGEEHATFGDDMASRERKRGREEERKGGGGRENRRGRGQSQQSRYHKNKIYMQMTSILQLVGIRSLDTTRRQLNLNVLTHWLKFYHKFK